MVPVRKDRTGSLGPGDTVELVVGEAVQGGWCVGRIGAGPVLFVRHALPGERVRAVITQSTTRFARADAVEILTASPGRVPAPCPYARPGGCGGCDWQHASLPVQREIKAQVISQQLSRIAALDRTSTAVTVEPLGPDMGGLGWRTRVRFAVGADGRAGLYRHRSHEIEPIIDCLIAHQLVTDAGVTRRVWPGARWVDVAVAPGPHARSPGIDPAMPGRSQDPPGDRAVMVSGHRGSTPRYLTHWAAGRDWRVSATGFWQVHPGAADVLAEAVLTALRPEAGETALDLFCGAGLFAGVLAEAVGPDGQVIAVERDATAAADARHNLRSAPWARVHQGDATEVLRQYGLGSASVAVLDPPRTGADRALIETLCGDPARGSGSSSPRGSTSLRRIGYVSCDPATLARDIAVFGRHGWRLDSLRAFDAFPMTHHVECLAVLVPPVRLEPARPLGVCRSARVGQAAARPLGAR
jgi:tRNA/tmRNA/rRNA uracil-C5-methylase (TrmA/RlmC/RlmD family)